MNDKTEKIDKPNMTCYNTMADRVFGSRAVWCVNLFDR